jgi:hypothetical protein
MPNFNNLTGERLAVPQQPVYIQEVALLRDNKTVEKLGFGKKMEIALNPTAVSQFRVFELLGKADVEGKRKAQALFLFRGPDEEVQAAIEAINSYVPKTEASASIIEKGDIDATKAIYRAKTAMGFGKTNAQIIVIDEGPDGNSRVNYIHRGPNQLTRLQTSVQDGVPNYVLAEAYSPVAEFVGGWQSLDMSQGKVVSDVFVGGESVAMLVLTGGLTTKEGEKSNGRPVGARWLVEGVVKGGDPIMRYLAVTDAIGGNGKMPIRAVVSRMHMELKEKLHKPLAPPVIVIR